MINLYQVKKLKLAKKNDGKMQKAIVDYFQNELNQTVIVEPLADSGLAHWHFRLKNQNRIVRIPKQSQMGLTPQKNLEYEKACYQVCQPSGVTPKFYDSIAVSKKFEMGGLIVEEIVGREIELKHDILKVAHCLAKLHLTPIDDNEEIIFRPKNPIQAMLEEVQHQSQFLDQSNQGKRVKSIVIEQFDGVKNELNQIDFRSIPLSLISFDCHPANYIVNKKEQAILVDLEKCRYSYAGFDLAHATLYTSTTWGQRDNFIEFTLSDVEVITFYQDWLEKMPRNFALASLPILLILRKLMWLWAVTWSAKWLVQSKKTKQEEQGQNWSAELSEKELVDTVAINVQDYLQEETILKIISTWAHHADLTLFFRNY